MLTFFSVFLFACQKATFLQIGVLDCKQDYTSLKQIKHKLLKVGFARSLLPHLRNSHFQLFKLVMKYYVFS